MLAVLNSFIHRNKVHQDQIDQFYPYSLVWAKVMGEEMSGQEDHVCCVVKLALQSAEVLFCASFAFDDSFN